MASEALPPLSLAELVSVVLDEAERGSHPRLCTMNGDLSGLAKGPPGVGSGCSTVWDSLAFPNHLQCGGRLGRDVVQMQSEIL